MEGMMRTKKHASHWWWLDSNSSTKRSPWLQSTLSELEDKTEAMLKLIEGDADSFAQRAEMYYRKRPELMSMVEDFYRTHRLLAERYDQLKSESGTRLLMSIGSPFSSNKSHLRKSVSETDQNYDSHSENFEPVSPFSCNKYRHEKLNYDSYSDTFEHDDNAESEVEDPEEEDRIMELKCHKNDTPARNEKRETPWQVVVNEEAEGEVKSRLSGVSDDEVKKLRDEIERLKEENRIQKDLLVQKDEEKREVMRQLSLSMGALKDGVSNDEAEMLREEIERLKEESMVQKGLLAQKDEEKREVVRQVSLSMEALKCGVSDDEAKKLSEEIEKLMEESKNQKDLLVQKDEEKREVIRQLSMSMGVLKDENLMLKKRIARDCKKRNPFEFDQKKSGFLNLFNRSSTQPNLGAAV